MSLSSMYAQLNSYQSSASWWSTSASQYQSQINSANAALGTANEQMAIARNAQSKINELPSKNQDVTDNLGKLGGSLDSALGSGSLSNQCKQINQDNAGDIDSAKTAIQAVIDKIQAQIDSLNAQVARATEGRDYSNSRAASYSAAANRMRTSISNYDGD